MGKLRGILWSLISGGMLALNLSADNTGWAIAWAIVLGAWLVVQAIEWE